MRHTRQEVMTRALREFKRLDRLVAKLSADDWERPLPRPETKDAWTVKDALAHITYFKADVIRSAQKQARPAEMRGLNETEENRLIFKRWQKRPPQEIVAWHRQVQQDLLAALRAAPDEWFSGRERRAEWPFDVDGHSAYHRVNDIEAALRPTRQTARPE
jgi:uncharacterized damage-inducible protein DinB